MRFRGGISLTIVERHWNVMNPWVGRFSTGLVDRSPKVLTSDSPARRFQLDPAAIGQVYFAAEKIDCPAPGKFRQTLSNGTRGRELQQATVRNFVFLEELFERSGFNIRGPEKVEGGSHLIVDRRSTVRRIIQIEFSFQAVA